MKPVIFLLAALSLPAQTRVQLPPYTRQVLPNGTVVDLMPRKGVPLVTVRALVKGGAESDPPGMAGLASITAELLRRGTPARTADRFSDELDSIGASFESHTDPQATSIAMEFLSKDADLALDLFTDAILRPTFPEQEVKKSLAEWIEASKAMKDSPMMASSLYFRMFFFGPRHPYGHPARGDELSLQRITRAEIANYHARMYTGANLIVVAAGDFDPAQMGPRIEKAFGAAPAGKPYAWKDAPAAGPASSGPRLLLVDKPDATQTYFWIGRIGISRTHPDRIPVWLVDTLLGGRFTSMLNDELRVNSGLTYGARSVLDRNRLPGAIAIVSHTQTASTAKAIDLALDVLKRLQEKGISADQLASVKSYVKGIFPTERLETADQLAAEIGDLELFGLDRREIDDLFARIDAVTLEQANRAAREYFKPSGLSFVLLGNAAKIRSAIRKYAPEMAEVAINRPGFAVPAAPAR